MARGSPDATGRCRTKGMGIGREQARTIVLEGQQREIGFGRGDPVRDDEQPRELHEEGLGPSVTRPAREKSRGTGASCHEFEELVAGRAPRLIPAEEVLMPVVVGGESRRRRRNAVVSSDNRGQGHGRFIVPTVLAHEPALQDHVPRQGMRNLAPLESINRLVEQPHLLHAVVEARGLDREGRGALANVVDTGDPRGEQAELLHRGQPRLGARELALDELTNGRCQPVSGEVIGHRRGVEQMQPQRQPMMTLRVVAEFGPYGSDLRRERHRDLLRWRVKPNGPRH